MSSQSSSVTPDVAESAARPAAPRRAAATGQIVGLDLIRFGAALLVLFYHFTFLIWAAPKGGPAAISGRVFDFSHSPHVSFGWVGVEIFFVLSGFVISYSASKATAYGFLRGRVLRLVPAAWICATLTLWLYLAVGFEPPHQAIPEWLRSVLFVPAGRWIDGAYWTLGIEVSFYALVFLLLWSGRPLEGPVALVGVASSIFWFLWLSWPHAALDDLAGKRLLALLLIRHGCEFALGVFLWLSAAQGLTVRRIALMIIFAVASMIEIAEAGLGSFEAEVAAPVAVWLAAIVLMAAAVRWNTRLSGSAVTAAWTRRLGLATYPLYLSHQMLGAAFMGALWRLGLPAPLCVAFAAFAAIGLSIAVAELGEPPLRRFLARSLDAFAPLLTAAKLRLASRA